MLSGLLVGALRARSFFESLAFFAGEAGLLGACSISRTLSHEPRLAPTDENIILATRFGRRREKSGTASPRTLRRGS